MKKFYTMLAALLTTAAMSAESVNWTVNEIADDYKNNASLDGLSIKINNNLSLTFDTNGAVNTTSGEPQNPIYRLTSNDKASYINLYSNNLMTVVGTDATITSITFVTDDDSSDPQTTQTAATWKVSVGSTNYNSSNPTWTGSATSVEFKGGSKTVILGLNIEYTVTGEQPEEPEQPEQPGDYKTTELYFDESMASDVSNVTLSENGVTIAFKTNSTSAAFASPNNDYFGTVDSYVKVDYCYRPSGSSTKGLQSSSMATMTFPCKGTLTIYAYNNNSKNDVRNLQIQQNDVTIFNQTFTLADATTLTSPTRNIYPVYNAEVNQGTAYMLWPDGGLSFYGFVFTPSQTTGITDIEAEEVKTVFDENAPMFDLSGRGVSKDYKGVVIQNGKKYLRR